MHLPARPSARPFLVAAVSCIGLVLLAIGFADRPFSTWAHAKFHGDHGFIWLTWIVDPIPPLAVAGLIGAGIAAAAGWRPGAKGRVLLAACLSTVAALVVKDELKILFGRTWPETWTNNNPSWIGNGTFGFEPLHGGAGWFSFPSGHTTLITAPMMVLWLCVPRLRALWAALIALVVIGLLGADYHWLSDTVAGFYLGLAMAVGMVALLQAKP
jgi:membrane-associated phospholipid phosphatase